METVLGIGLANAAVAALLALLLTATLILRKPALTHALAVLVLLKLLTPPIFSVPVTQWLSSTSQDQSQTTHTDATQFAQKHTPAIPPEFSEPRTELSITQPRETPSEVFNSPEEFIPLPFHPHRREPIAAEPIQNWFIPWLLQSLPLAAAIIWLYGSIICASVILFRIIRFQRLLRFATLAPPALQSRAEALAHRMGVDRTPQVWFVPGAVCPMLWAIGSASRLLVPNELWDKLSERQRSSLLAHELAHLKRRDHWVRLIELLASVLYWWCPVTWYARRCLREAEEQCCDAWVVWALPGSGRDYASALLEAVEFVTLGAIDARPMPALASGMGQFHQLKRRLIMIKNERVSKSLSKTGWAAVCALALGLLPLTPTRAQNAPAAGGPATPTVPAVDPDVQPPTAPESAPVPVAKPPVTIEVAPVTATFSDFTTTKAPAASTPAVVENLRTNPNSISLEKPIAPDGRVALDVDPKLKDARDAARAEVKDLAKQLERAQRRLADLEAASASAATEANWKRYPKVTKPETASAQRGQLPPGYDKPSEKHNYTDDGRPTPSLKSGNSVWRTTETPSRERRLEDLEANLKMLLDQVQALKNETTPTPKRAPVTESGSSDPRDKVR